MDYIKKRCPVGQRLPIYLLKFIIGIMLLLPWICGILPSHFSIQSSNTIL